ncbi:MAG TPA: T9SS type A sorting domain-containing protein, partial [Parafilimonas sp.]
ASITKDGKIDSSFGTNGITTTDFSEFDDGCDALALQQDGKIIAAGGSTDVTNSITYITLARYNGFLTQKQILIAKIRHWIQHHNGIEWDNVNGVSNYVVQRSYDGIHFSSITKINASNSSNYTYADPLPLSGNNYYRLQTTSVSGAVNYSNVIAVTEDAIKISPNPATNSLHIEGLSSSKTKLTVVDFTGNIKLQTVVNNNSYNLNIASLTTGNYLLKIESGNDVITKKFVKE